MSTTLRIGDIARATGFSVHAIRWYEREGLIPHVARDRGGRRSYHPDHVEWLRFVDRLRFTGMAIKDIRAYAGLVLAGHRSLGERQVLLARHRADLAQRMEQLTAAMALIDAKVDYYRQWERDRKRPKVMPVIGDGTERDVGLPRRLARSASRPRALIAPL